MSRTGSTTVRERLIESIGGYSRFMYVYRSLRPRWLWRLTSPYGRPTTRYVRDNGLKVRRGWFEGMQYPQSAVGHTNYLGSKLLGTYEPGVIDFLRRQVDGCELFVDLGSGDGFFCTGLAMRSPIDAIGFETNGYERKLAARIADLNDARIQQRGPADQDELNRLPEKGKLLLLCDLEGLEEDLLDPVAVPRLADATMIVETHEQFRPDVVSVLTRRFAATHRVERIFREAPDPGCFDELSGWDADVAGLILSDGHGPEVSWMTFVPK